MGNASSPMLSAKRSVRKSSGVVVPHKPNWHQRLAAWFIYAAIKAVAATLRFRWNDPTDLFDGKTKGPVIYCVWHNRLALCMVAYGDHGRDSRGTPGMAALVSASRDGGFLTAVLDCFRVQPVRGSSSRRGPQALLELTTWADRGYDLAITPDGPRGPRYIVQDGVASLAQLTGLPIVPFSYYLERKITVKSWDGFQIPLPFSRCEMNVGRPILVPREASDAQREELRRRLETTLREISRD